MTPEEIAEMRRPIPNGPQALWTLREQKQKLLAEVRRLQTLLEDTRARQAERLKAAEDVCVMYGWTTANERTSYEKAMHEVWSRWTRIVGSGFLDPDAHPDLSNQEVARLASQFDETRVRVVRDEH